MCIQSDARRRAVSIVNAQLSLIAVRSDGKVRDAVMSAMDEPSETAFRHALETVRHGPWELPLATAIAELGLLAAGEAA